MIGFVEAIRNGLQNYVSASGRATRAEFWWWMLFYGLLQTLLGEGPLGPLVGIVLLLPTITVLIRRLHDTDRSGWFAFIGLIPAVGVFILLALCAMPSTEGSNRYGPPRVPAAQPTNPWQSGGAGGWGAGPSGRSAGAGGWGAGPSGGLDRPGTPGGNWDDTPGGAGSGGSGDTPPPPPPRH